MTLDTCNINNIINNKVCLPKFYLKHVWNPVTNHLQCMYKLIKDEQEGPSKKKSKSSTNTIDEILEVKDQQLLLPLH